MKIKEIWVSNAFRLREDFCQHLKTSNKIMKTLSLQCLSAARGFLPKMMAGAQLIPSEVSPMPFGCARIFAYFHVAILAMKVADVSNAFRLREDFCLTPGRCQVGVVLGGPKGHVRADA